MKNPANCNRFVFRSGAVHIGIFDGLAAERVLLASSVRIFEVDSERHFSRWQAYVEEVYLDVRNSKIG